MKFKSKQFISRFMAVVLFVCMLMGSGFATVGSYIIQGVVVNAEDVTIVESGKCGANVMYTLDSNGVLVISGLGNMRDYAIENSPFYKNNNIKTVIINDGVTSIGNFAFESCANLTNITIPNSMVKIGNSSFRYSGLTSVIIPENVKSIGNCAFGNCKDLHSAEIPDSITAMNSAFFMCENLKYIKLPSNIKSIGAFEFVGCEMLKNINIPNNVKSIGESAFEGCVGLIKIIVPNSIKSIDDYAFDSCEKLKDVYYSGSKEEWDKIKIGMRNDELLNANIHFNYTGGEQHNDPYKILEDELLYKTKLYTSDGGDVYKRVLEGLNEKLSRDDIATEDKIAMLNNFYKLFNITDIQEGTAYCIEAMNGKRAYDFLTNDENFLAYQFKNYLQNTVPGTIARGLMITDGWIFNNELKQWIDPKTYLTQETQSIKNYKEMLLDFMNYTEDGNILSVTSDVSNYFDNVQKFVESIADSLSDETLAKFESEKSKCTTPEAINDLMKKYDIVEKKKIYSVKGFDELGRIFESAGIVYQITGDSADDILAFISLESKLETISFYKKFLEMIYDGEDYLPTDLRIAAKQLYEQAVKPYYFQITDLISNLVYDIKKSSLNIAMYSLNFSEVLKYEIKPAIKSKYPKIFTDEVTDTIGTFGDAMAVIEASAFVVNLLTNVTDVVNKAYHSEAYAFLGTYFSHVLNESKNQFNANQTIENAWDFYDKYHLLFRIRVCGENAYLKMCEEKTMTKILAGVMFKYFDVKDRKKYVEDTFK